MWTISVHLNLVAPGGTGQVILLLNLLLNGFASLSYEDDVDFGYFEGKYFDWFGFPDFELVICGHIWA